MKYQEIANSIRVQFKTQQIVIRSYRRGRNNCPSKQTLHTDFAEVHSSSPKKGGSRSTWYDYKLCSARV